jgi:hypothetical protein
VIRDVHDGHISLPRGEFFLTAATFPRTLAAEFVRAADGATWDGRHPQRDR